MAFYRTDPKTSRIQYEQHCMLLDMRSRELHALSGAGSVYQIEWVAPQTPAWLRTGPEEDAIAQI